MGRFSVIPQNTFKELQTDAGVLLKTFDPANPVLVDSNIICATTGGVNPTCKPTYSDMGEDVDNCPAGMMELKRVDSRECALGFTAIGVSPTVIRMALGAADIDGTDKTKIIPRMELKNTDFSDIWWVGDRSDGGLVAVCLKNALSTDGFSLQTTKNGKGQISVNLMGHVSMQNQNEVPMVFYSIEGEAATEGEA